MQTPQPYTGGGNTCLRGRPSRFRRIVPMAKKNKGGKKGASTAAVALLKETETPFEIREYEHAEGETSFGLEAAQKLGADPEQVFKTLLIVHDKDFAVAVVPVSGQLNLKAAAHALGWKSASMCDPKIAERRTGYVVGGISPLGQKTPSPTLLDASAEQYRTIMVSGGKRGLDIELSPADLLKLTGGSYTPPNGMRCSGIRASWSIWGGPQIHSPTMRIWWYGLAPTMSGKGSASTRCWLMVRWLVSPGRTGG